MAKRKGLSADEKRIKLLELFHETNDVFQLKDLERLAPKEKGIVMQSVKIVLQELVDDGQVQSEKISGSIYYWSFPSENLQKLQREFSEIELKTNTIQNRLETVQAQVQLNNDAVDDQSSIEAMTMEIKVLEEEKEGLTKQMAKYEKQVNYDEVKDKENNCKKYLDAANRWTDNIYMIKSWCKRKFYKQDRELNKAFGISDDLDYLDLQK